MDCSHCGSANRAERRFCGGCGAVLDRPCAACGFANEPGARFCGGCGAATAPGRVQPAEPRRGERERRHATVLFADVVNFTSIAERLDPEVVHTIMDGAVGILSREVSRFGGRVNAFTGDGVMALFGTPLAEEDHAARAVHAALAAQRGLATYAEEVLRTRGVELRMRIGVNTGLVLAGGIGSGADDGGTVEHTALGDTVNLAARLESAASPGGVIVGEATRRAAGEAFVWEAVGPLTLKGKSQPVPAWAPVSIIGSSSRFEALARRGLTPFVGRRAELTALLDAWRSAEGGAGRVVGVVGEAGLGKSRLLHEFKRALAERGASVVEGSCFTYGEAISYLPFLEIARAVLNAGPHADPGDAGPGLDAAAARLGLTGEAPYLRALLGLDPGDPRLARQLPMTIRQRTVEALAGLVCATARERPTVLVLEDVHWIDEASEQVLAAVLEAAADAPLLLLLAYRPEQEHARAAAIVRLLAGAPHAREVALAGLPSDECHLMASQVLGESGVSADLVDLVEASTEGNPLFIEELVRELVETGALSGPGGSEPLALPTTVEGVLLARVDRLDPELRRLLQVASALGRVFPYRLLQAVAGLNGGLDPALERLEELDFVRETALAPERQYAFKHVLTQEAVYRTMVSERRQAHHARAGQAVEALYGDRADDWVEILAHHYTRSGDDAKALDYLALAHAKASRTCALVVADGYFAQAMAILDRLPPGPETEHRRIAFLVDQMLVAFFLNRTRSWFELATAYAAQAARVADLGLRGAFHTGVGRCLATFGPLAESVEVCHRAATDCEAGGSAAGTGIAYEVLEWACLWTADFAGVHRAASAARRAFAEEFVPLHSMWASTASAWAHAQQGAWAEATAEAEAELRAGEAAANDSLVAFSALILCIVHTGCGRLEDALRFGELARRKAPTPAESLWAQTGLAQAWCRTGRAEEAAEVLAGATPLYAGAEFAAGVAWSGTNLGEAYWRAGRLREAADALEGVVDVAGRHGVRFFLGSALRLLGEVRREAGEPAAAADALERALAVLTEIGAENEQALARAAYGRLLRAEGDRDAAAAHLHAAVEIFERLGTLTEPERARAELEAVGPEF